ncbi:unnamed protein product, partial [Mesorhabditis belari]|uniref:Serpentine receptor class gamma n=1 Tax=Mesorhabditis belari TaxID=2138241 RepID=A0AAF3FC42_9BILA
MPFSHHRIWKNRNINCVCFLIVLVGNSLCYQYLFYTGKIFMEFNGYIVQGPAAAAQTAFAISTVPVMSFVYPFASLGINIVIFFALLHLRWKRKSKKAMGTIEWNLFLICLFTLIIQFLLMLFLRYAYKIFDLSTVAFGLNLVSDFSTLSETFIGLALNTTMRGKMIDMLIKSTSFRKIFKGSSTRQETSILKVTAW